MSRIGKKVIKIPDSVSATFNNGLLSVKGAKGVMERMFKPSISIKIDNGEITFVPEKINKQTKALWGTTASHTKNMIDGVSKGFEKKLILEGVGFKSEVKGNKLVLALGFSHPVEVVIPENISLKAEKNIITGNSINKDLLGEFMASVRALKKPEPYKGKGFRYEGEVIRRKEGKKSV